MSKTSHDFVSAAKARITELSPAEARDLIQSGACILDVREPEEYAAGHIPGAISIPRGLLEFRYAATPELHQPGRKLLVYCKTSGRAALATVVLHEMGATGAVSLAGGYDAWVAAELPVDLPPRLDFE